MKKKSRRIRSPMVERSRQLRRDATHPEQILWNRLRGRQVAGLKFRRQYVIGKYIVDFCCEEKMMVVELDGRSHEGRKEYDVRRTESLNRKGYSVVRCSNDDVIEDVDNVAEYIARKAGWRNGEELETDNIIKVSSADSIKSSTGNIESNTNINGLISEFFENDECP